MIDPKELLREFRALVSPTAQVQFIIDTWRRCKASDEDTAWIAEMVFSAAHMMEVDLEVAAATFDGFPAEGNNDTSLGIVPGEAL